MFGRKSKTEKNKPSIGVSEFGATVRINIRFFTAAIMAILAVRFWPDQGDDWRFGIMSFACGAIACGGAIEGVKELLAVLRLRAALRKQTKDAAPTKQTRSVDRSVLEEAGMKR